jgi:hypothetical protein
MALSLKHFHVHDRALGHQLEPHFHVHDQALGHQLALYFHDHTLNINWHWIIT